MDDDEYRKGDQKQFYAVRVPIQRKLAVCVGLGAMTDDDRIGPSSAFCRLAQELLDCGLLLSWLGTHDHCFSEGGMLGGRWRVRLVISAGK